MNNMMAKFGLQYVAGKLDGKKTYFGALLLALLGLTKIIAAGVGVIGIMFPDVASQNGVPAIDMDTITASFETGCGMVAAGIAAAGIGHKIEKKDAK